MDVFGFRSYSRRDIVGIPLRMEPAEFLAAADKDRTTAVVAVVVVPPGVRRLWALAIRIEALVVEHRMSRTIAPLLVALVALYRTQMALEPRWVQHS